MTSPGLFDNLEKPGLPRGMIEAGAEFSEDRKYRTFLSRIWDRSKPICIFGCLNPSIADREVNDPSVTRMIGYAKRWGFGGLYVVNVFSLVSTDPAGLKAVDDPVGPGNRNGWLYAISHARNHNIMVATEAIPASRHPTFVCGWGIHGGYKDQDRVALGWLRAFSVVPRALKVTAAGFPSHPLYLRGDLTAEIYEGRPE